MSNHLKIRVASDLHLEQLKRLPLDDQYKYIDETLPHCATDSQSVLVLAGDIVSAAAQEVFQNLIVNRVAPRFDTVVYIPGNHEYYHGCVQDVDDELARICDGTNIIFTPRGSFSHTSGVTFVLATLWTDYRLTSTPPAVAAEYMNDYRACTIRIKGKKIRLRVQDTIRIFHQTLKMIKRILKASKDVPTVVVTHHGPSPQSIAPRFQGMFLNCAFITNLERVMKLYSPYLWIHGHVHDHCDYMVGTTRVVANPRGYRNEKVEYPYVPIKIIEVPTNE